MMTRKLLVTLIGLMFVGAMAQTCSAQVVVQRGPGGGMGGPGGWNFGQPGQASFESFMQTLSQLNMTPEFTLDKDTKAKLQQIQADYRDAQKKFFDEIKDDQKKLQEEQMAAWQAKDQDQIKELAKKSQELYAKGPKADEWIAKAKAALTPEQLKAVEEKIKKDQDDMKARMEEWRKQMEKNGVSVPVAPDKN